MTTETRKRQDYTEDFKRDAVSLVTEQGYKISEAARSLDIGANLLGRWRRTVRPERLRPEWTRDRILVALEAEGIPGLSGSCPEIYREEAFSSEGYPTLPVARTLGETSLMLPVHPTLAESEIDDMVAALQKVMALATA